MKINQKRCEKYIVNINITKLLVIQFSKVILKLLNEEHKIFKTFRKYLKYKKIDVHFGFQETFQFKKIENINQNRMNKNI